MKVHDEYTIRELSKEIFLTNVMPSGNSTSFIKISSQLIEALQKGADLSKINRILSSELVVSYGLSVPKSQVDKIAKEVFDWYQD